MVAVTVLEPNGGESFKLGQPNTIRWSGGSGWVMIGLVDHQFDTDRNMILGWITRESSPDDSITWGGEEVCAADMKTCWKVKELSPGPYRVIVVSRNAAGVVCIDSQEDDCNLDVSDNGFTLVDSCGDGLLATSVGPSATRVKASEVRQYLGMIDLDLDGNGTQEALSDGLLLNRYMSGMTGATLVNGVIGSGATRTTPGEILAFIGSHLEDYYDIDGNGSLEADYDGEIALRYLFDPQVPTLIGEECDDSNVIDGDGCSATCTVETGWMCYVECGTTGTSSEGPLASLRSFFASLFSFVRAQLTGSGSTTEPEQCRSVCAPFCGDGLCMTVEDTSCTRCDGTNDSCDESCYACPEDCGIPSACIEEGKEGSGLTNDACCEDLISVSNAQRDSEGDCAVNEDGSFLCTLCGDGVCGLGENACNCPHDCLNLPIAPCGDGWVDTEVSEECDDGNDGNGDGCSVYCMIENGWECNPDEAGQSECASIFGDGLITGTEECDDANTTDGDGCTLGMIDDGWECAGEPSECTEIPQVAECGNSVVEEGEECDDGNDTENDGCNSCSQEHGWVCSESGSLSICATECGDGKKAGEEQCDDSNSVNGDGCSSSCAREVGFECAPDVEPSLCTSTCGDGIKVGTEECDDDNNDDGDGCNSACRSETCTDSDSGKVLSVKGTTVTGPNGSGSFVTQVDYCGEDGMIGEYSCSGSTIVLEEQSCPTESVCGDGACIPPPEATLTITAVTSTQTQLLGGTLGKAALQLKLKAGNLGDSGNTVRIDTIGFNVITNDGRPHPSVAEAQIFRKGGTEPIAHATAAACGSGSNFMLCADLSQTGLSLTETAGDILSVRVLANSDEQTSSHQVFQLGLPPDGIEASEVRAGNSVPLSINDGNGAAAGEILVFPSDRLVNPATKNKTVYGTIQYPVYAKVLSITDANEDADNTALSAGAKDVAAFTFSAAANVNTKDGLNVIALSGAYFNVVTANVTVNADSLQFYNSAAPDVVRSCRAYSKTGTQLTGEISGSFLAYCNLRDGVLDTQIEQGTSSTFKLRVTILNPKVDDAKSSQLIVSLRQFNKPGLSFGTTGSHLLWEDADQGSATSFRWAEDSLGYVESTRYFFN
jgi:cysteine-rich repeat protein